MSSNVRGRITVHPRGFGFLVAPTEAGEVSAFITPPDLNPFLDGDIVTATIEQGEGDRTSASGITLVERTRRELFGQIVTHGKRLFLKVDRLVSNTDWPFEDGVEGKEGEHLVAEIKGDKVAIARRVPEGTELGLERVIARHGIRSAFPFKAVDQARTQPFRKLRQRRDIREIPTVTIDGPTTTDIDDALSVLPAGPDGALRVLVTIADVAEHVAEATALDEEARIRGTSVYLAGRVLPMLPDIISSDAASLVPNKERLGLTVEMRIDAEGAVTAVDIFETILQSHARLTYDAVADYLERGRTDEIPAGVGPTLRWLRTAAARLGAVRASRGGVELDRDEAYIAIDEVTREPVGVASRVDTSAHRLVERLMVAANEAVANWLVARGLPGLYRVHDEPEPDRVAALERFAHNFGIEAGFAPRLTPRGLAAFEAQFAGLPNAPAIRTVLGRTLGNARYTVTPSQHFGLGAPLYLHFTSPIRRYADLAVHRVVKRFISGERNFGGQADELETLALHLNRATASAAKAEKERHHMLVARLFASKIGAEVLGNIVSVKPFGLVLQMAGTGVTGTLAIDSLPDGPYRADLAMQALVSTKKVAANVEPRRFSVGQPLRAIVASTNEELGRVDLTLVDSAPSVPNARASRPGA